nr:MAG TPA: hypothetical protein [Crassvirales sp.]
MHCGEGLVPPTQFSVHIYVCMLRKQLKALQFIPSSVKTGLTTIN